MTIENNKKPKTKPLAYYQISNFVAYTNIGVNLDLFHICTHLKNTEFNPEKCAGLFFRLNNPFRFTAMIFSNGKINFTGAKNIKNLNSGISKTFSVLRKLNYNFETPKIFISNICAYGSILSPLRIKDIIAKKSYLESNNYEVTNEPNLEFWKKIKCISNNDSFASTKIILTEPKCTINIFSSGKFVLKGINDKDQIGPIVENIGKICEEFLLKKTE